VLVGDLYALRTVYGLYFVYEKLLCSLDTAQTYYIVRIGRSVGESRTEGDAISILGQDIEACRDDDFFFGTVAKYDVQPGQVIFFDDLGGAFAFGEYG